jgi:hypothetical protein
MASTGTLKHTWSTTIKNDSGAAVVADPPVVVTFDSEENGAVSIPAGETAEIDAAVDVSTIQSGFMTATQDCVVKTNAADATGGETFNVPAGKSVSWNKNQASANPFTIDITKLFVKNNGTQAATFRYGFGCDLLA